MIRRKDKINGVLPSTKGEGYVPGAYVTARREMLGRNQVSTEEVTARLQPNTRRTNLCKSSILRSALQGYQDDDLRSQEEFLRQQKTIKLDENKQLLVLCFLCRKYFPRSKFGSWKLMGADNYCSSCDAQAKAEVLSAKIKKEEIVHLFQEKQAKVNALQRHTHSRRGGASHSEAVLPLKFSNPSSDPRPPSLRRGQSEVVPLFTPVRQASRPQRPETARQYMSPSRAHLSARTSSLSCSKPFYSRSSRMAIEALAAEMQSPSVAWLLDPKAITKRAQQSFQHKLVPKKANPGLSLSERSRVANVLAKSRLRQLKKASDQSAEKAADEQRQEAEKAHVMQSQAIEKSKPRQTEQPHESATSEKSEVLAEDVKTDLTGAFGSTEQRPDATADLKVDLAGSDQNTQRACVEDEGNAEQEKQTQLAVKQAAAEPQPTQQRQEKEESGPLLEDDPDNWGLEYSADLTSPFRAVAWYWEY